MPKQPDPNSVGYTNALLRLSVLEKALTLFGRNTAEIKGLKQRVKAIERAVRV